ncbi:MAG: DNA cytosine methyltransferase [Caldilineaceae bacterium]|nr:DNA cytosine methyltransferase [Caldilineaceae bacterium]
MKPMNDRQMEMFPLLDSSRASGWFAAGLSRLGVDEEAGWPDAFGDALRQWNVDTKLKPVRAISLFSGAGGLDIGFHDAGFAILECNEIEPSFAATLHKNASRGERLWGTNIVCQDIRDYTPSVQDIDFIIGGPPCQTFSAASARAAGVNGTDDERGNLFLQYARIIDQIKPVGFLFENVYRIVGAQSGRPWKQIQAAFRELGYKLYWRILDAADYGVPQFRERLIIVGLRHGEYRFPFPSHGPDSPDNHPYYSARRAISGIDTSGCKIGIGGRHGHLLNDIPPGLNYSFYTERMGHPTPIFGWRSKFSDYLYKADPDTPVRTIKAQGGQYTGPFSWENRPFTIDELKRLQTFPDDYIVAGNRQTVIHQLGNSVPPQLARVLALSILDQVFDRRLPFHIHAMPDSYQLQFRARKSELTAVYAEKAAVAIAKLPKRKNPLHKTDEGTECFSVTQDFCLDLAHSGVSEFCCTYGVNKNEWTLLLSEPSSSGDGEACFSLQITPPQQLGSLSDFGVVPAHLSSSSSSPRSLLAIWKYYEHLVKKYAAKDDLVQLFGYYQYKMAFSVSMTLVDPSLTVSSFWRVVQQISSGHAVGSISPITTLAELFEVTEAELAAILVQMKELGYEIRNHRTNRQIPADHILIPYAFPSLNERSLQRLTRL